MELILVTVLMVIVGASAFSVEVLRLNLSQTPERHAEMSNDLQRALAHLSREIGAGVSTGVGAPPAVTVVDAVGTPVAPGVAGSRLQIRRMTGMGGDGIADPADFANPANFTTAEYQLVGNALRFEPNVLPPSSDQVFIIGPGTGTQNTLQVTALAFTQQPAPNLNQVQIDLTVNDTTTAAAPDARVVTEAVLRARSAQ